MPHLLRQGTSVYYGHMRTSETSIADRLAVQQSLTVLTTWGCRGWYSNSEPFTCEANALTDCTTVSRIWVPATSCVLEKNEIKFNSQWCCFRFSSFSLVIYIKVGLNIHKVYEVKSSFKQVG